MLLMVIIRRFVTHYDSFFLSSKSLQEVKRKSSRQRSVEGMEGRRPARRGRGLRGRVECSGGREGC